MKNVQQILHERILSPPAPGPGWTLESQKLPDSVQTWQCSIYTSTNKRKQEAHLSQSGWLDPESSDLRADPLARTTAPGMVPE